MAQLNNDGELQLDLTNGFSLRTGDAELLGGDYVRLVDPDGCEVLYWDHQEWVDDPVVVMGAIIAAAINKGVVPTD